MAVAIVIKLLHYFDTVYINNGKYITIDHKKYINLIEMYIERLTQAFKQKNNTEMGRNCG